MVQGVETSSHAGWILVAGLALTGLGLAAQVTPPNNPGASQALITPGYGTSDSNDTMIAVTGVDVTGGSVLYLVDTERRHLSVYQATGGTRSTMNLKWVGARNIDLDMQVDGWNDKSQYSFRELVTEFEKQDSVSLPNKK